jgi:subtilisin family serine protease
VSYLRTLASAQRSLAARIERIVPGASVYRRYSVVVDAIAVIVPAAEASRLASVPGVARVYPSVRYHPLLDSSPAVIGAPLLWGPNLETAGNGIKIGIVDDGVDVGHRFFAPAGLTMPPGFPKGDRRFTSAKVIAARAFAPPGLRWRYGGTPFDPVFSEHGTHVAGIAAGDHNTTATSFGVQVSGVAPKAYIGNYKVLTVPTTQFGLNGNSPEIAAGVEAAVRDGMDVVNLSLGEAEIEPSRDLVVAALNGAAAAGVVPVVAAGNEFDDFGFGSVGSPGSAAKAITVGAASKTRTIEYFSSSGPTPVSLQLKPEVSAPGGNILSSVPAAFGLWDRFSGTSMAAPHVAGGVALLRQRHPGWTVAQLKSALTLTGDPVRGQAGEVASTREGGGMIDLPRANNPLIFTVPQTLSFGLLRRGTGATRSVSVSDAGGGAGDWTVSVSQQVREAGVTITGPTTVTVPGKLGITVTVAQTARPRDLPGFVVLTHGTERRRIPYWFRVTAPALAREPRVLLHGPRLYRGNTRGKPALVSSYRYPETAGAAPAFLPGPEQVFRLVLRRPVANFGVVVVAHEQGVRAQPRVVRAGDENRLVGYPGLPLDLNPYRSALGRVIPVAGAVRPIAGSYDIVFDTPAGARPGAFTFRLWIGDRAPPNIRIVSRPVQGQPLRLAITDAGSGVDPSTLVATIDGRRRTLHYSLRTHHATVGIAGLRRGAHSLVVVASDFQETKNMEDVAGVLPNTRRYQVTVVVR